MPSTSKSSSMIIPSALVTEVALFSWSSSSSFSSSFLHFKDTSNYSNLSHGSGFAKTKKTGRRKRSKLQVLKHTRMHDHCEVLHTKAETMLQVFLELIVMLLQPSKENSPIGIGTAQLYFFFFQVCTTNDIRKVSRDLQKWSSKAYCNLHGLRP